MAQAGPPGPTAGQSLSTPSSWGSSVPFATPLLTSLRVRGAGAVYVCGGGETSGLVVVGGCVAVRPGWRLVVPWLARLLVCHQWDEAGKCWVFGVKQRGRC